MKRDAIPVLGYALLGLLHQKAQSGYDLRKIFAETAMGNYSSSPGAIYPALQRLEADELITGAVEESGGMRRKRVYQLTSNGRAALKHWLALPVQPNDVKRGTEQLMLRFAYMEQALGIDACIHFLRDLAAVLAPYIAELEGFLAARYAEMPLSGRLALENGIRGYRSMYDWTEYALQAFLDLQTSTGKSRPSTSKGGLE